MREKNRIFAEVTAVDLQLLNSSGINGMFSVRSRTAERIVLFSLSGRMINLVTAPYTCGPDFVLCKQLPPLSQSITEDGWLFEDTCLKIPFMTQLKLEKVTGFDSGARIDVRDFPGHMKSLLSRRLRQSDCNALDILDAPLKTLSVTIREHLTESAEIPIIGVVGLGDGEVAAGDAALCGMLLTARCFVLGGRYKIGWFHRLSVEVRRFLHRASPYGRNWLSYAIDGRMTETQQSFFSAMARDFEGAGEILVKKISDDEMINGKAFLTGVNLTLDMIQSGVFDRQ